MECDPLVVSDEESGCGSEEETTSCMTPSPANSVQIVVTLQEQLHFTLSAVLVAISTSAVVITLPLYMESINVESDIYCSLFFTGAIGTIILTVLSVMCYIYNREIQPRVNIPCLRVLRIGALKGMAGAIVLFSVDRKRVLCHLQDPILGICLAFSLSFYFLFCEKVMGLQRIFSAMVIIVGVFISVDYQLCNEFRCHGNERMANPPTVPEHTSAWAWGYHLAWAIVCAVGLALWALAYALLENDIVKFKSHDLPALLATVSRLVATQDLDSSSPLLSNTTTAQSSSSCINKAEETKSDDRENEQQQLAWHKIVMQTMKCSLSLAASLIAAQLAAILLFAWVAMFRPLGKASSPHEWWNFLMSGLLCHVTPASSDTFCSGVALYGWIFAISYSIMIFSSIHFLTLSESSVFTLACGSLALPVTGMWWSFFSSRNAVLSWEPALTGELVCSLLGLPIILLGLIMLCRSHWVEAKFFRLSSSLSITRKQDSL